MSKKGKERITETDNETDDDESDDKIMRQILAESARYSMRRSSPELGGPIPSTSTAPPRGTRRSESPKTPSPKKRRVKIDTIISPNKSPLQRRIIQASGQTQRGPEPEFRPLFIAKNGKITEDPRQHTVLIHCSYSSQGDTFRRSKPIGANIYKLLTGTGRHTSQLHSLHKKAIIAKYTAKRKSGGKERSERERLVIFYENLEYIIEEARRDFTNSIEELINDRNVMYHGGQGEIVYTDIVTARGLVHRNSLPESVLKYIQELLQFLIDMYEIQLQLNIDCDQRISQEEFIINRIGEMHALNMIEYLTTYYNEIAERINKLVREQ